MLSPSGRAQRNRCEYWSPRRSLSGLSGLPQPSPSPSGKECRFNSTARVPKKIRVAQCDLRSRQHSSMEHFSHWKYASPQRDIRAPAKVAGRGFLALLTCIALTASFLIVHAVRRERALARMQSDFVATVSHEFRTPLTALHQFTEMLRDSERFAPEEGKERRLISYDAQSRATSRLTRLVEQLLDFRRLEAGKPRYNFEPQDSTEFVGHVVNEFRPTAEALGYDVRFSGNCAAMIDADSEALGRALWQPARQRCQVLPRPANGRGSSSCIPSACEVAIDVRDQGIGIPLSEHTLIFGKFQRGEEARRRGVKGTGIGLTMVERNCRGSSRPHKSR